MACGLPVCKFYSTASSRELDMSHACPFLLGMALNRARWGRVAGSPPAGRRRRVETHGRPSSLQDPQPAVQVAPPSGPFSSLQVAVCTVLAAHFCRCKIMYAGLLPSQKFSPGRLSSQTTEVVWSQFLNQNQFLSRMCVRVFKLISK